MTEHFIITYYIDNNDDKIDRMMSRYFDNTNIQNTLDGTVTHDQTTMNNAPLVPSPSRVKNRH